MAGYGSDQGFADWAAASGYTVPSGTVAAARERGSVYIDATYGDRFTGEPASGVEQDRAWPRIGAEDRFGNAIGSASIPTRVVTASYHATLAELRKPGSMSVTVRPDRRVRRQKVEGIEREFFAAGGSGDVLDAMPVVTTIEGLLQPLLIFRNAPNVLVV
ncbi:DnaT-like ssDNA-binding protein [Nitratireductor sp. StC3]|uniref:DnaT-like ssDNA-binding protein n=1 Tax=Nitratireductor sp. StC3 TaxID=2126741 RepID=UPI000D0D2821|nr:DnaT-like ssDNA-binding protein [Nitratireductor sp. StC3]PSM18226.1 hypothetical protein C7T96_10165 [Nitratireductor sp. StC3]